MVAITFVLVAMLVHLLVTSSSLQWGVVGHYFFSSDVLSGLIRTLYLTAIAMLVGIVGGTILALMRISKSLVLSMAASSYIWLFRGTPLLVQLLFWFNIASFVPRLSLGIPFGPSFVSASTNSLITILAAAVLGLGLNEAAYMAEIVSAGIVSVDPGQGEAALALGMPKRLIFRRIVLPQAMRVIIPPTGNEVISMLKTTSLVVAIAVVDLLGAVTNIYNQTFQIMPMLILASLWYLMVSTILSIGQFYLERFFARGALRTPPPTPIQRIRRDLRGIASKYRTKRGVQVGTTS